MRHLLIAGGGTGGHIAPAIAVGEKASSSFRISYACTPRPVDKIMYGSVSGTVHVLNPPRIDKGMKLLLPFSATAAFLKARSILKSEKVDIVLGTGGYSSFFCIAAARSLGIPAAVFDSNAIPGKSNRVASRFCRIAFTGLPGGETGLHCPSVFTGTPVSSKMKEVPSDEAKNDLGISSESPVILFLGGSQGAKAINDLALSVEGDVKVLLQCGERDYSRVRKLSSDKKNVVARPFIKNLSEWYSAAELAVTRAGGQTIAELSAFRLPVILVPFPHAAEDHQRANAEVVEAAGGGILQDQKTTDPVTFNRILTDLFHNREKLSAMGEAMGSVSPSSAADSVVSHLKELV